jgi:hypothetical protein
MNNMRHVHEEYTLMKTSKHIEETYVAIIISWNGHTMQGGKLDQ